MAERASQWLAATARAARVHRRSQIRDARGRFRRTIGVGERRAPSPPALQWCHKIISIGIRPINERSEFSIHRTAFIPSAPAAAAAAMLHSGYHRVHHAVRADGCGAGFGGDRYLLGHGRPSFAFGAAGGRPSPPPPPIKAIFVADRASPTSAAADPHYYDCGLPSPPLFAYGAEPSPPPPPPLPPVRARPAAHRAAHRVAPQDPAASPAFGRDAPSDALLRRIRDEHRVDLRCAPCAPPVVAPVGPPRASRGAAAVPSESRRRPARRGGDERPAIAAGDGGERPPPPPPDRNGGGGGAGGGGGRNTPQNLRDNPERQAKVKTELCHFYEEGKECPWGDLCNYAHGKHELKFKYTSLYLMESSGQIANAQTYLARPCMTWVCTGACPFGRRCPSIHDPSVAAPAPSWLPLASSKTNAEIITDTLAAHRENSVHQENPLVAQTVWEGCRPSRRGIHRDERFARGSGEPKTPEESEREWIDTYALVCNERVSAFAGESTSRVGAPRKLSGDPAGTEVPIEQQKVSDFQKLCIAFVMRTRDGIDQDRGSSELHRDYVFAPTHSLGSELCMILQVRYFLLPDVNFNVAGVTPEDVAKEITFYEYRMMNTAWSNSHIPFNPSRVVTAHEVAFAPKGDHGANVSIWFDAPPVSLEPSQIKRSRRLKQKKKAQIRNDHKRPNANGALVSRTSSVDFPGGEPEIDPFVPMLPAEDRDDAHALVLAIMAHRIDSVILNSCPSVDVGRMEEHRARARELQRAIAGMAEFHKKWTWPKRQGMRNVTRFTKSPPSNRMPYIPLKDEVVSPCVRAWDSFVDTIGMADADDSSAVGGADRLSVFRSIENGASERLGGDKLPHILTSHRIARAQRKPKVHPLKKDETWKEILLGLPTGNGGWEASLRVYNKNAADNVFTKRQNIPLSTVPFVQA
ncbi:hypothetical protein ACHAWF_018087 [Thalassiosira exigua]